LASVHDLVCISYASGAGGETVARRVAAELGFVYVDDEIVLGAAARGGIDPRRVADEEQRKSLFDGLLDYLHDAGAATLAPPPPAEEITGDEVREFIRESIADVAARGQAVIAAHAASYVVDPELHALRVLVTAPADTRAERLAADESLEPADAAKRVRKSDSSRADYLRRFHGVAEELPTHYDLVINTAQLGVEEAAALVVAAAKS
jgi:cytidylate kinase